MLTLMNDLPVTVVGVVATGQVSKSDYDTVLLPALKELYDRTGKVSFLLELDTELHDFTTGAWMEDAKLGLKYFTKFQKVAIVTHSKGIEWFTNVFSLIVPGEYKGFLMEELARAKQWVAE